MEQYSNTFMTCLKVFVQVFVLNTVGEWKNIALHKNDSRCQVSHPLFVKQALYLNEVDFPHL